MNAILMDTGPLVALLHQDDQNHKACTAVLKRLKETLVTVWPVITEAMYLLNFSWRAQDALWEILNSDVLKVLPLEPGDYPRMRELMRKYRNLPMDFADAALVRVAERERLRRVFTLDRRHFEVYRALRTARFTLLP